MARHSNFSAATNLTTAISTTFISAYLTLSSTFSTAIIATLIAATLSSALSRTPVTPAALSRCDRCHNVQKKGGDEPKTRGGANGVPTRAGM
eukprot:1188003-Prymnesium_polylepis.1